MFTVGVMHFDLIAKLPYYLVLSVVCGLAAVVISKSLYWVEDQFERLPFNPMWWPALAGLALGIIGYFVPRVLGVGYETISDILNNRLPLVVLLSVMVFKAAVMIITLGSGTSGGLLAPTFMSSAAMGAAFAIVMNTVVPSANLDPAAFALIAMAAVFGAASRATFTFIIFAYEITRDYNAILPLTLICVIADAVARRFMEHSIMTEKLARRGVRVQQEYEANVLDTMHVSAVMTTDPVTVPPEMTVQALMERINANDAALTRHQALLIVDSQGQLSGIVTRGDLLKALRDGHTSKTVLEAGTADVSVGYPDDTVRDALNRMLARDIGRLPVVSRDNPHEIVGYLSRGNVISAHLKHLADETKIESGWLQNRISTRFSKP
jgi:CBS domain-containing protein